MVSPRRRVVIVEGGGKHNPLLATELRKAFRTLAEAAGAVGPLEIVAGGSRADALKAFVRKLDDDSAEVLLLVDAEEPVASKPVFLPWDHVAQVSSDRWVRPTGATDGQLHFMAVCTETWLLADPAALEAAFGMKLSRTSLRAAGPALEARTKAQVMAALQAAVKPAPAASYRKGRHCFQVLAKVRPNQIRLLPWAGRFLDALTAPL